MIAARSLTMIETEVMDLLEHTGRLLGYALDAQDTVRTTDTMSILAFYQFYVKTFIEFLALAGAHVSNDRSYFDLIKIGEAIPTKDQYVSIGDLKSVHDRIEEEYNSIKLLWATEIKHSAPLTLVFSAADAKWIAATANLKQLL